MLMGEPRPRRDVDDTDGRPARRRRKALPRGLGRSLHEAAGHGHKGPHGHALRPAEDVEHVPATALPRAEAPRTPRVRRTPAEFRGDVERQVQELQRQIEQARQRMETLRERAQEQLDTYVPPHVQKEAHRKGFHMVAGIAATPLFLYTGHVYGTLAGLITLFVILAMEVLMTRFGVAVPFLTKQLLSTRRSQETFSWASTMFIVAALAILWLTPLPVAFAALAMLGLGDGMSALVGKAIGRHKLWYNRDKSWEGSLAGFLAGTTGALGLTWWYYAATGQPYPLAAIVPICIAGALAASIAESVPQWEDNFSVPIASSATMLILWLTTGLMPRHGALIDWLLASGLPGF